MGISSSGMSNASNVSGGVSTTSLAHSNEDDMDEGSAKTVETISRTGGESLMTGGAISISLEKVVSVGEETMVDVEDESELDNEDEDDGTIGEPRTNNAAS